MRKSLSILLLLVIVLTGMHLSVASHYCGGKVAAVKWSFSGRLATCGMEGEKENRQSGYDFNTGCCHNEISYFTVDNDYNPTTFQVNVVSREISQLVSLPANIGLKISVPTTNLSKDISPPVNMLASSVNLTDLCIFRI